MTVALVLPQAPGLLPSRGRVDPFSDLRDGCLTAIRAEPGAVTVIGDDLGRRVATSLLDTLGRAAVDGPADVLLVMADGSARRAEKAPGHLDERSFAYDEAIERALATGDAQALADLDLELGAELLAAVRPLPVLGRLMPHPQESALIRADDPFGVRYWIARWAGQVEWAP